MQKNKNKKLIFLTSLIAFTLSAILPFFAVYNLSASSASAYENTSIFGDKILICTNNGFKLISLKDIENGKDIPETHTDYQCAMCFFADKPNKYTPHLETKLSYAIQTFTVYVASHAKKITNTFLLGPHSHAPPTFV